MVFPLFEIPIFADILNFFIPFLLVFSLVYALLSKTEYVSESRSVNSAIAFAMAMFTALAAGKFLMSLVPYFAVYILAIFGLLILLSFAGVDMQYLMSEDQPFRKYILSGTVLLGIIFVLTTSWLLYQPEITDSVVNSTGIIKGTFKNASLNQTNITETIGVAREGCFYFGAMSMPMFMCMITEPKVMGMLVLLILMAVIVYAFSKNKYKNPNS
jgi:hypothetical protein